MAAPTIDDLLRLVEQLSPDERQRLRTALNAADNAARAAQRQRNLAAIELLDAWAEEESEVDDSWWPAFARALDADRTSRRPLFPEPQDEPDHRP